MSPDEKTTLLFPVGGFSMCASLQRSGGVLTIVNFFVKIVDDHVSDMINGTTITAYRWVGSFKLFNSRFAVGP